ncbi:homing endonuclease with LAGLIDADG motif [Bacillus phage vB_BanS_Sophrita]|uniref:DNA endonuclease n=1 Tax=Bacillus phage vB_BanS_Sophrita TaxID=2894790 RepID=A0AAE8YUT7_9CAUD|nr:homing endonuclease with LAGLIDADG motif [Bacillus phage vB_BanS_Sophrita]UGO50740.1 putative DNA endonuclease [Bacillus phage vB_BanS_Sophrita]
MKKIDIDMDILYGLYINDKMSISEIVNEIGYSKPTISRKLKEYGLTKEMQLEQYKVNDIQHDLIIGSILGDGSLLGNKKNKYLEISHSKTQKDYIQGKFNIIKDLCNSDVSLKTSDSYRFITKCLPLFNRYYELSTYEILDNLNENSLAIWLGDDGTLIKEKFYNISIARFNQNEISYVVEVLHSKFNLNPTIKKDVTQKYGHHGISFNLYESEKLSEIIKKSNLFKLLEETLNYKLMK